MKRCATLRFLLAVSFYFLSLAAQSLAQGNRIEIAAGTPEDVVREKRSYTGAFLKPVLKRQEKPKKRIQAAE